HLAVLLEVAPRAVLARRLLHPVRGEGQTDQGEDDAGHGVVPRAARRAGRVGTERAADRLGQPAHELVGAGGLVNRRRCGRAHTVVSQHLGWISKAALKSHRYILHCGKPDVCPGRPRSAMLGLRRQRYRVGRCRYAGRRHVRRGTRRQVAVTVAVLVAVAVRRVGRRRGTGRQRVALVRVAYPRRVREALLRLAVQDAVHELLPDVARQVDAEHVRLFLAPALVVPDRDVLGVGAADVHDRRQLRGEPGVPGVAVLADPVRVVGALVALRAGLPGTGLAGSGPPAGQLVLAAGVFNDRRHRPRLVGDLGLGQADRRSELGGREGFCVDGLAASGHLLHEVRVDVHATVGDGGDAGRVVLHGDAVLADRVLGTVVRREQLRAGPGGRAVALVAQVVPLALDVVPQVLDPHGVRHV